MMMIDTLSLQTIKLKPKIYRNICIELDSEEQKIFSISYLDHLFHPEAHLAHLCRVSHCAQGPLVFQGIHRHSLYFEFPPVQHSWPQIEAAKE